MPSNARTYDCVDDRICYALHTIHHICAVSVSSPHMLLIWLLNCAEKREKSDLNQIQIIQSHHLAGIMSKNCKNLEQSNVKPKKTSMITHRTAKAAVTTTFRRKTEHIKGKAKLACKLLRNAQIVIQIATIEKKYGK